jgi:hypothetical protein
MKKFAAFLLVFCGGCASAGGDSLLEDSLFGDIKSAVGELFTTDPPANPCVPTTNWYSTAGHDLPLKPPPPAANP